MSHKKWKITKHIFGVGALTFTVTRPLLNVLTEPCLSACSGTSTPLKCNSPRASGPTAWVKRFPQVVAALNNEVTSLTGKKPAVAIKEKDVSAKPSTPYSRPVGQREKKLPSLVNVRYLYQPGELEGGVKRATDPIWSLKVYSIERSFTKPNQPVLYYLHVGPKRGFVREELLVVPPNTQLPPEQL